MKRTYFFTIFIVVALLNIPGKVEGLVPPLDLGQVSFALGYEFHNGAGQYLAGKERYVNDSLVPNPSVQKIPLEFHYGILPKTEMFFEWPIEFRNSDYGDARGFASFYLGVKSSFPKLLGMGFILVSRLPFVTGSLDKVYSSEAKELQYGGFYHYRWPYFQMTAMVKQSYHPGGIHHPDAANSLIIEAKPEAIWAGKYYANWSVHYQHWQHIAGDAVHSAILERFLLNISPGFGFQIQNGLKGEITALIPAEGKNLIVFKGVDMKLYYTLPWNLIE